MRCVSMGTRQKCRYCDQLAVAHRSESGETAVPVCAYHIRSQTSDPLSTARSTNQAKDADGEAE